MSPHRDDGFVLVTVLIVIGLLAAIALAFSFHARSDVRTSIIKSQITAAQSAIDGMVRLIGFGLPERMLLSRWRASDTTIVCRIGESVVAARVIDAGGLVDLNASPADLLGALVSSSIPERGKAEEIAANIALFRAPLMADEAERAIAAYVAAGLNHGPKLAPFESVSELDQVLGISPDLYLALRPYVTVHSRLPGIDPSVAPSRLTVMLSSQQTSTAQAGGSRPQFFQFRSTGRTFVVRAVLRGATGITATREAVFELSSEAPTGIVIRDWTQLADVSDDQQIQTLGLSDCASTVLRLPD